MKTHKNKIKMCKYIQLHIHTYTCGQIKVCVNGSVQIKMHLIPLKVTIMLINDNNTSSLPHTHTHTNTHTYVNTTSLSKRFCSFSWLFLPTTRSSCIASKHLRCNLIASRQLRSRRFHFAFTTRCKEEIPAVNRQHERAHTLQQLPKWQCSYVLRNVRKCASMHVFVCVCWLEFIFAYVCGWNTWAHSNRSAIICFSIYTFELGLPQ